jgi:hypothetical protein
MSSRSNFSISNQTTSVASHDDLLATEATLKQILGSLDGTISLTTSDTLTHTKIDTTNGILEDNGNKTDATNIALNDVLNNLETANTTLVDILAKHLDPFNDSVTISNLDFLKDTVSVVSSTVVKSIPYDLNIYGETMYADSVSFPMVDPFGRDGWYWSNSATTGGSNCYWYSNSIVPQYQMLKSQVECVYVIIALDRVKPELVLPFQVIYSLPTGVNDIIPGFAHSSWVYTIPSNSTLNAGETIMLTIGDNTKVANIHPELRRVELVLSVTNGDGLGSETIGYMSLNTESASKPINGIQYLLKNAGFYDTMTYKAVDYEFNNSLERQARLNLSGKLGSSGLNNIYVNVNTDHGSVGLAVNEFNQLKTEVVNANDVVKIQGYEGSLFGWTNVTSTSGALNTTDSATTALNGKVFNSALVDTEAIKVYTVNSSGGGGSSNIEAIIPGAPTIPVPLSATSYYDGTNTHYPLETFDNALNAKVHNSTEVGYEDSVKVFLVNGGGGGVGSDVNITNTSLDVHCYGSSNGTIFHHLKTTAVGVLQVEARVHDSIGTDISSTVVNT